MIDLPNRPNRRFTDSFASLAPNIHWARRMHLTIPENFERRINDFELLYVQKGVLHAKIEGESFILHSGELLYIPSGVYHKISFEPEILLLGIHFDYFGEMTISDDKENPIELIDSDDSDHSYCLEPDFLDSGPLLSNYVLAGSPQILPLLETIVEEFNHKKHGYELICRGIMLQVIYHLHQSQQESNKQINPRYGQMILSLTKRMESKYAEDWSYSRVAFELNLHKDYAAKLFKETVGLTPSKYIQQIRHHEAKRLLRETDNKLEVIAELIGYDDTHYFCRIFSKLEGLSPGYYRKLTKIL